jgi:putative CocE/NonD family hydrolase
MGERASPPPRQIDLKRGLAYRPVREADRVARRRVDAYRDWVDHPRRDGFWDALRPALPDRPPPALLIAGWYDFLLSAQLDDYRALRKATSAAGSDPPRLVIGPWCHGRIAHPSWRARDNRVAGVAAREILAFLDRTLGEAKSGPDGRSVRIYVAGGGDWRERTGWPLPGTELRTLHLRGGGRLDSETPAEGEPPARFRYDPADPAPSNGGPLLGSEGGARDQRPVEGRADVVCYSGPPLERELEIAGSVRLLLYAASSAPDTDFTARLLDVAPDGKALNLCEGILRCRWRGMRADEKSPTWLQPGEPTRLEIELGETAWRFRAGHRLRLAISSSSWPRFERHPNTRGEPSLAAPEDAEPARQAIFHDPERPSQLLLPVVDRVGSTKAD